MIPFGIESLASEVARMVRSLPLLGDRLEAIAESTAELPTMRARIDDVAQDTVRSRASRMPWHGSPTRWR